MEIISIRHQGIFSIQELNGLLPIIRKVTFTYVEEVETLLKRLESLSTEDNPLISKLEGQVNQLIKSWHEKVRKLGGEPKGLWMIDFDAGDGYFAWKFPETEILYWHHYSESVGKRIPLSSHAKYKHFMPPQENVSP